MENNIPNHIGFIMDGNRRWSKENNKLTIQGHNAGYKAIKNILNYSRSKGIKAFTLYAFSTENWKRDSKEVKNLMKLFIKGLLLEKNNFIKNRIKFTHLGRKDRLPKKLLDKILDLEEATKDYTDYYVNVCLDYGGRDEIVRAVKKIVKKGLRSVDIDPDVISNFLDSARLPHKDPELIIRTSGEQRLSNFLTWQSAYSEFYFSDVNLPDFDNAEFDKALQSFDNRKRRFGGK